MKSVKVAASVSVGELKSVDQQSGRSDLSKTEKGQAINFENIYKDKAKLASKLNDAINL